MKLGELAGALGLELRGDRELEITGPAPIEAAGPGTVSFVSQPRYLAMLERVAPACVIAPEEIAQQVRCAVLVSSNPGLDFARTLAIFHPPYRPASGVHPTAQIATEARIDRRCQYRSLRSHRDRGQDRCAGGYPSSCDDLSSRDHW